MKKPYKGKNHYNFLSLLCFFSLIFFIFYLRINKTVFLDVFTQRDIQRALNWFHGNPYWPGPEMSTGGNLPGPFFYFLLIPPLIFGENIYSQSLIWFITWLSLSWTLAFYFAGKICKQEESLLIFMMFLLSCVGSSLHSPLSLSWNPAFAMMFHILALMVLYYWREEQKDIYLYGLGLIIGLGIQVHFLVFIHLLTALFFFVFQREKKTRPFLYFIILILIPNLPYFIMHIFGFINVTNYSTSYLSGLGEKFFSEKWFSNVNEITSFRNYVTGPFLYLIFSRFFFFKEKRFFTTNSARSFLIILTIPVFTAFLAAKTSWYLNFVPVFLALFFSKVYDNSQSKTEKFYNFFICGVLFVFPLLTVITDSLFLKHFVLFKKDHFIICLLLVLVFLSITKKFSYGTFLKIFFFIFISKTLLMKNYHKKPDPKPAKQFATFYHNWIKYEQIKPLFKQIALETDWSPKTVMNRIFLMLGGERRREGLLLYYALAKEELRKENKNPESQLGKTSRPDGYFVVQYLRKFRDYVQKKNWKEYLSSSSLVLDFIRNEIKTDKIILKSPRRYEKYWLIPYQTTDQSAFYEGFHNTGQPYYWEEPDWLKNCQSTNHFKNRNRYYYCMVFPGHRQRAGVFINLPEGKKQFLEVGFFGPILGLKYYSTNFDGFTFWSNIQISLFCNGKESLYSIPNIGYNPVEWREHPMSKLSRVKELNSPLKLRFSNFCERGGINRIKLNFDHLRRMSFHYPEKNPEKKEIIWENF